MAKVLKRPALTYDEISALLRAAGDRIVRSVESGSSLYWKRANLEGEADLLTAWAKLNAVKRP
jgi:hypothetical protein